LLERCTLGNVPTSLLEAMFSIGLEAMFIIGLDVYHWMRLSVRPEIRSFSRKCVFILVCWLILLVVSFFSFWKLFVTRGNGLWSSLLLVAFMGFWALILFSARKPAVLQTFVWARLTYTEASEWLQRASDQKPSVRFEWHSPKQIPAKGTFTGPQPIAETNQQSNQAPTAENNARPPAFAPTPSIVSQTQLNDAIGKEDPPLYTDRVFEHYGDNVQRIPANGIQAHSGIPQGVPLEKMEVSEVPSMWPDRTSRHSFYFEQGIPTNSVRCVPEASAESIEQITDQPLTTERSAGSLSVVPSDDSSLQTDPVDVETQIGFSRRSYGAGSTNSLYCPCCLDDMKEAAVIALLRCGHLFCEECLKSWAVNSSSCPSCRACMLASRSSFFC